MSTVTRPRPATVVVCDLCDGIIDAEAQDRANLIARATPLADVTEGTKHAAFWWPTFRRKPQPDYERRQRDFHGRCIVRLVEDNLGIYDGAAS